MSLLALHISLEIGTVIRKKPPHPLPAEQTHHFPHSYDLSSVFAQHRFLHIFGPLTLKGDPERALSEASNPFVKEGSQSLLR